MLLLAIILVVAGCSSNTSNTTNNQPNPTTGSPTEPTGAVKLSDSQYAANSYLISGDTLDDAAQQAMSGFSMQKTANADGTTTISLSSTNPEYKNQTYTLQPGQQLYFIERALGDDSNNQEGAIGDDNAVVVDSQGYIISALTTPNNRRFRGNGTGFGNMTDAQRQQFMQQRIDACNGKTDNDSCTIANTRGAMNGTCQTFNNTLECMVQRPSRTGGAPQ